MASTSTHADQSSKTRPSTSGTLPLVDIRPPGGTMQIILDLKDPSNPTFSPGDVLKGTVVITAINTDLDLKEIHVTVHGTADVQFISYADPKIKKDKDKKCEKTETYVKQDIVVLGGTEPPLSIPAGEEKKFGFTYTLPKANVPSTFQHVDGSITYGVEGRAEVYTTTTLSAKQTPFLVKGHYDLNEDQSLNHPGELYDRKRVRAFCCCGSGLIEMLVKFKSRGFLVGGKIKWEAEIGNNSSVPVKSVTVRLKQHIIFHTQKANKMESKVILDLVKKRPVGTWKNEIWQGVMDLPKDIPVTTLGGGTLIILNYGLEFELKLCGCRKPMISEIPIALGSVPLTQQTLGDAVWVQQYGKSGTGKKSLLLGGSETRSLRSTTTTGTGGDTQSIATKSLTLRVPK